MGSVNWISLYFVILTHFYKSAIAKIREECPWFFAMRDLIAEWPNLIPTGIGHSALDIDLSILGSSSGFQESYVTTETDGNRTTSEPPSLGMLNDDIANEIDKESDLDVEASKMTKADGKWKVVELDEDDNTPDPKKYAHSTAESSSSAKPRGLKKPKFEDFSLVAQAEEVTRQKEIDLAKVKVESAARIKLEAGITSINAKKEVEQMKLQQKTERWQMKAKMKMERDKQRHELCMEQLRLQALGTQGHVTSSYSAPGHSSMDAAVYANPEADLSSSPSTSSMTFGKEGFDFPDLEFHSENPPVPKGW